MCAAQDIEFITVSRDDTYHESWPDIAIAANGDLVCAYQESDVHGGGRYSTIVTRVSSDQGETWSDKTVVCATQRGYSGWLNCSKILRLQDDSLMLAMDNIPTYLSTPPNASHHYLNTMTTIWLFRSFDNGRSWHGPEVTSIYGSIVPTLAQLRDGTLLIGLAAFIYDGEMVQDATFRLKEVVHRSTDNGKTWSEAIIVAEHPDLSPGEGDFVQLDTGEIICYIRNGGPVDRGLKAISRDGGLTWSPAYGSGPWRYIGRPDVGLLSTGEVFLTTRIEIPSAPGTWLGVYTEPQSVALQPTPLDGPVPPEARWVLLDADTNEKPDRGYSGWVELPDGSVYVVDYITAEAPPTKPFIRGYRISRGFIDNMGRPE